MTELSFGDPISAAEQAAPASLARAFAGANLAWAGCEVGSCTSLHIERVWSSAS